MQTVVWIGQQRADDEDTADIFREEGIEVLRAEDEAAGMAAVRARRPVLVLVDRQLAAPGGLEVLKHVRAGCPDCNVALVTNGGEADVAVEVLRAGAIDYLRRPVDLRQLRRALGRAKARAERRAHSQPRTILVLDDHEPTLGHLSQVLGKEGYRVLAAPNGRVGMRLFATHSVDLILADLRMPEMGGLEVLRETKGRGAEVEFVVMTGFGDEDAVVEALRIGATDFLRKPLDLEQLLVTIERALQTQSVRRGERQRERAIELVGGLLARVVTELVMILESPDLPVSLTEPAVRLFDAAPLGVLVANSERATVFANRRARERFCSLQDGLTGANLREVMEDYVEPEELDNLVQHTLDAPTGTVEQVMLGPQVLFMTPLHLVEGDRTKRFVALVVCGAEPTPGWDVEAGP